jgi:glycosyltransferase involved in cell wall biosynthesis
MTEKKGIVFHDYLQVNGGAERLVIALASGLGPCKLAVSGTYPDFLESGDMRGVNCVVLAKRLSRLPRIPRALLAFLRTVNEATDVDWAIYSGVYAPLAVTSQKRGKKIFYCHTPPRFAFDWESQYLQRVMPILRPFLRLAIAGYRQSYLNAVRRMDVVITNSHHVQDRFKRATGLDSQVIYPPIDTAHFQWKGQGDYYLSLGRLEPNKRIYRVIEAFLMMPEKKLVVASGGSELEALKRLAAGASNIHFTGWVDDAGLATLIGHSIACIYIPRDEDFGMSTVEAMAAGKPILGVNEGGIKESMIDGETGLLLPSDPTVDMIVKAISALSAQTCAAMRAACENQAARFSEARFLTEVRDLITVG